MAVVANFQKRLEEMITEDYVSFEIAKLLKEKGFDEDTVCVYIGRYLLIKGENTVSNTTDMPIIPAPTLQMAMKWLREEYNIHIEIHYLHKSEDYSYVINNVSNGGIMCVNGFDSYENAVEAAILECLTNLI